MDQPSARWWSQQLTSLEERFLLHGFVLAMVLGVLGGGAVLSQSRSPSLAATPALIQASPTSPHAIVAHQVPLPGSIQLGELKPFEAVPANASEVAAHTTRPATRAMPAPSAPTASAVTATSAKPGPRKPDPVLRTYTVREGDNPYDLAQTFGIAEATLLSANSLQVDSLLSIGQRLTVPKQDGLLVKTAAGDSVSSIAAKYHVTPAALLAANQLKPGSQQLAPSQNLLVPGAEPALPAPTAVAAPRSATPAAIPRVAPIRRFGGPNAFPWGQCTWWAAQQRPDIGSVESGNALTWLWTARAAGLPTGWVPRAGAIVVYQPGAQGAGWSGHVAYVTSVAPDGYHFMVSEMNFPWFGVATGRESITGPGVGFIY